MPSALFSVELIWASLIGEFLCQAGEHVETGLELFYGDELVGFVRLFDRAWSTDDDVHA